ncbi:prolactin regulatory element-binding protein [Ixodes scapularis]
MREWQFVFEIFEATVGRSSSVQSCLPTRLLPEMCQTSLLTVEPRKNMSEDDSSASEDGRFVGVGHLSGAVEVYIAFSLQRLYRAEHAHNIFVTGLEFLKSCDETRRLAGNYDASLISISVDNHIVAHHIPFPATMGMMGLFAMFVGVLLMIYLLMDFLGL